MDENENQRNEIAATLFSILAGLAVLLLVGWITLAKGCTERAIVASTAFAYDASSLESGGSSGIATGSKAEPEMKADLELEEEVEINAEALQAKADHQSTQKQLKELKQESDDYYDNWQDVSDENDELKIQNTELKGELSTERTRRGQIQNQLDAKTETSSDLSSKSSDYNKIRDDLNLAKMENTSLGKKLAAAAAATAASVAAVKAASRTRVASLEEQLKSDADSFKKRNNDLQVEIDGLKKASSDQPTVSNGQIRRLEAERDKFKRNAFQIGNDSKKKIAKLTTDNDRLTAELEKRRKVKPDRGAVQKLEADNKSLATRVAALTAAATTSGAGAVKIKSLTEDNERLKVKVEQLNSELLTVKNADKLQAAVTVPDLELPLLVQDPAKLDGRLLPLFVELRGIEEDNPQARVDTYAEINGRGKAAPLRSVNFGSGSFDVSDYDKTALQKILAESDADAKYLVVGYASVEGDAASNAKLSSRRASEVARAIVGDSSAESSDRVQAVYFGQTNRFSQWERPPNRVVEVWRVAE